MRLSFALSLDPRRGNVLVIDDGMALVCGVSVVAGPRETVLMCRVRRPLRPGPYAVVWTAAAAGERASALVQRSYLFMIGSPGPPLLPDHPVALQGRAGPLTLTVTAPSDRVVHQTYTIDIRRAGWPVVGADVTAVGRSLDMQMGDAPLTTRPLGAGRYSATGDVVMAGDWQLQITVRSGGATARTTLAYQAHY